MLLFLVGMPATGKSTFGRRLAQRLSYRFIDLDKWIEQEVHLSVSQIFMRYGESFFRKTEQHFLHHTADMHNTIVATGGGTPCYYQNMRWIKQHGTSIFLDTPLPILAERILSNPTRPLFQNQTREEVLAKLHVLYQNRSLFYKQADFILRFSTP